MEAWLCPCGANCEADAHFCPECGAKREPVHPPTAKAWACACGAENKSAAKFCGTCGDQQNAHEWATTHLVADERPPASVSPELELLRPATIEAGTNAAFRYRITSEAKEIELEFSVNDEAPVAKRIDGPTANEIVPFYTQFPVPGEFDCRIRVTTSNHYGSGSVYQSDYLSLNVNPVGGRDATVNIFKGDVLGGKFGSESFDQHVDNVEERLAKKFGAGNTPAQARASKWERIPLKLKESTAPAGGPKTVGQTASEKFGFATPVLKSLQGELEADSYIVELNGQLVDQKQLRPIPSGTIIDFGARPRRTVAEGSAKTRGKVAYSNSHAVLVGISEYNHLGQNDLPGCAKDVMHLGSLLVSEFGFNSLNLDVLVNDKATTQNVRSSLRKLTDPSRVAGDHCVVFYYSGHGSPDEGKLAFSDGNLVELSEIITALAESPARHKLLVLDSCHCGYALASLVPGTEHAGISAQAKGWGRANAVLYVIAGGTSSQQTLDEGTGGLFTNFLVSALMSEKELYTSGVRKSPRLYADEIAQEVIRKCRTKKNEEGLQIHIPQSGKLTQFGEDDFSFCLQLQVSPAKGTDDKGIGKYIYERALPSIATLKTQKGDKTGTATGFLAIANGYMVTADHVVEGADKIVARFSDGEEVACGKVVYRNQTQDLAVIELKTADRPLLKLVGDHPDIGSDAYLIGSPAGLDFSISDGVISQIRDVRGGKWYQHTCPSTNGNSGGPLIGDDLEVMGVLSHGKKLADGSLSETIVFASSVLQLPSSEELSSICEPEVQEVCEQSESKGSLTLSTPGQPEILVIGNDYIRLHSTHRICIGRDPSRNGWSEIESLCLKDLFDDPSFGKSLARVSKSSVLLEFTAQGTLRVSSVGRSKVSANQKLLDLESSGLEVSHADSLQLKLGWSDADADCLCLKINFEPADLKASSADIDGSTLPNLVIYALPAQTKVLVIPCGNTIAKSVVSRILDVNGLTTPPR